MPSGSVEAAALKPTMSGASPEVGLAVKLATGGWLAGGTEGAETETVEVAVSVEPSLSVTVSVTVYVSAVV